MSENKSIFRRIRDFIRMKMSVFRLSTSNIQREWPIFLFFIFLYLALICVAYFSDLKKCTKLDLISKLYSSEYSAMTSSRVQSYLPIGGRTSFRITYSKEFENDPEIHGVCRLEYKDDTKGTIVFETRHPFTIKPGQQVYFNDLKAKKSNSAQADCNFSHIYEGNEALKTTFIVEGDMYPPFSIIFCLFGSLFIALSMFIRLLVIAATRITSVHPHQLGYTFFLLCVAFRIDYVKCLPNLASTPIVREAIMTLHAISTGLCNVFPIFFFQIIQNPKGKLPYFWLFVLFSIASASCAVLNEFAYTFQVETNVYFVQNINYIMQCLCFSLTLYKSMEIILRDNLRYPLISFVFTAYQFMQWTTASLASFLSQRELIDRSMNVALVDGPHILMVLLMEFYSVIGKDHDREYRVHTSRLR